MGVFSYFLSLGPLEATHGSPGTRLSSGRASPKLVWVPGVVLRRSKGCFLVRRRTLLELFLHFLGPPKLVWVPGGCPRCLRGALLVFLMLKSSMRYSLSQFWAQWVYLSVSFVGHFLFCVNSACFVTLLGPMCVLVYFVCRLFSSWVNFLIKFLPESLALMFESCSYYVP